MVDRLLQKWLSMTLLQDQAPVAQLDRASVYGTEGLGFESLQARFSIPFRYSIYSNTPPTEESQGQEHVSGMFSELENDPDFMQVAKRWSERSEELTQAFVRLVTQV
jgi:hypothetical protein